MGVNMKLARLRLRNFRCFKEEVSIDINDMTALIGSNDAGKSTIMDALDVFLNDNNPDKDDGTKDGNPRELTIICEFTDLIDDVVLDDVNPTTLKNEFLLNADDRLEIHKYFDGHLQKPKCRSIEAHAIHPTVDGAKDLLKLKNSELKKRAIELGVDLEDIDQRVNALIREKIRNHFDNLQLAPSMIPLMEENAKKIWTGLSKYLPAFALFKSDRASTDQDPEAQDPLKVAVREAIKNKEAELKEITDYVRKEVQKIANSTLKKLREMDSNLAKQLTPKFKLRKWEGLFQTL